MPQTAADERDPKFGYMVVKFENLNTSGFFTRLQANIYSSTPLQVTGEKIVPTLGVHGAVNFGVKGELKIPLSHLFFLGMKGPLKGSLHFGACETVLQCNVGIVGEFTFEHLKFDAITAFSQSTADKPATSKKTTITCVKGKLTKKVTAEKPKCPAGYKVKK